MYKNFYPQTVLHFIVCTTFSAKLFRVGNTCFTCAHFGRRKKSSKSRLNSRELFQRNEGIPHEVSSVGKQHLKSHLYWKAHASKPNKLKRNHQPHLSSNLSFHENSAEYAFRKVGTLMYLIAFNCNIFFSTNEENYENMNSLRGNGKLNMYVMHANNNHHYHGIRSLAHIHSHLLSFKGTHWLNAIYITICRTKTNISRCKRCYFLCLPNCPLDKWQE